MKDYKKTFGRFLSGATHPYPLSTNVMHYFSVVIASRNGEKVATAAQEMGQLGTVWPTKCNIRHEEDVR